MITLHEATVQRLYKIACGDPVIYSILTQYEKHQQDVTFEQALLTIAIALAEQKAELIKQLEVNIGSVPLQLRITNPDEDHQ